MKKIKEFYKLLPGTIFLAIIGYYFFYDILFALGLFVATAILFVFIILGVTLIMLLMQKFGFNFDNSKHIRKLESLAVLLVALVTYSFISYFVFSWLMILIL